MKTKSNRFFTLCLTLMLSGAFPQAHVQAADTENTDVPPVTRTTPVVAEAPAWNRLQSFSNPELFMRHAAYHAVLAASPINPYMDSMWKVVPGLSDGKGISFESLNFRGHFLRRQGDEVVLANSNASSEFKASATFFKEPGLADATFSSFRSANAPNQYLRQVDGTLRMGPVVTATERANATFRLISPPTAPGWNNPIVPQRADPHVTLQPGGTYYFTASVPEYNRIELRRAKSLGGLTTAEPHIAWRLPAPGITGYIWAPELHRINGKWYIYFAGARGRGIGSIRMHVLENKSADPFTGTWTEKGPIKMNWDSFNLDATTFEHRGVRYLAWAQAPQTEGGTDVYIAKMDTPWSITGNQVLITKPEYPWELRGGVRVNEAPSVLIKNGHIFMTYSASATDATYALGLLTADEDADLLNPKSWKKSLEPVLASSTENSQFGPGHNCFTTTPDGKTNIIVYHARSYEHIRGSSLRNPDRATRAQVIRWRTDGTPDFGVPVPDGPQP
jgi:GH43 family beta-xylosidase